MVINCCKVNEKGISIMKRGIIFALFLVGIILGIGYGLTKAADVEVILVLQADLTL